MKINLKSLNNLPRRPGVYLFKNKKDEIIYIGKSGNLRNRIKSYFPFFVKASADANALADRSAGKQKVVKFFSPAKVKILSEIFDVEIIKTDSEIEALIKEAELIKKYKPKFNVLMRDSKNYLFVGFTKEDYPRLVLTHQPMGLKTKNLKLKTILGPFTDAGAVVKTLRLLRHIFPYCTCRQKHNTKCLNAHIGRCLTICCLKIPHDPGQQLKKQYQKNIRAIKTILSGRGRAVLKSLERELKASAKVQNFEHAQKIKGQLGDLRDVLDHVHVLTEEKIFSTSPALFKDIKPNFRLLGLRPDPKRIETYDISNIQGQEAVGSMVVFAQKDGKYLPDKSQYRKFKIRTVAGINDTAMMAEIIRRRLGHPDWPRPQLIVIDGGRGQLNAALKALRGRKIRAVSLAKKLEEVYLPERPQPVLAQSLGLETKHLFQAIRDEAHRFAISYHRKLRRRQIIQK